MVCDIIFRISYGVQTEIKEGRCLLLQRHLPFLYVLNGNMQYFSTFQEIPLVPATLFYNMYQFFVEFSNFTDQFSLEIRKIFFG